MKTFFKRIGSVANNNRGIALLVAIFAMVLTIVIATEVAYETSVEYVQASQAIDRVKAYYAAESGVELSLFRILLYRKVIAQFGDQLKDNRALLDPIWQLPFAWPPTMLAQLSGAAQDDVKDIMKNSTFDSQYAVTIDSEGGKIDVNALGSGNKALISATRQQLLQIFQNTLKADKNFKKKYENFKFEDLLDNIQDYVSEGAGVNGRDKKQMYKQPDGVHNYTLPPSAPFKTIEEMHMVAGMEDEFFALLKDRVTVYGARGINVNYAPAEVIRSLDPQITDEVATKVLARRTSKNEGGPFKDENDFYSFLQGRGVRTDEMQKAKIPLIFDPEYNFRITSVGSFKNVAKTITVVTYDIDSITSRQADLLNANDKQNDNTQQPPPPPPPGQPPPGTNPGANTQNTQKKVPTGRPRVVLWKET